MRTTGTTELGRLTWTDVDSPLLVVPIGSCEQHGPHLPIATDTIIACALASDLAVRRGDCAVTPPLTITASGEHQDFPGTLSIGTEAMAVVLVELVRSADWASGVVLVNGHGGNLAAVTLATSTFELERRPVLSWWPHVPGGDMHAGHAETSLMMAIAPDLVRFEHAVAGPTPSIAELVRHGVRRISESGVLGDPSAASAEAGARLFAQLAAQLADAVGAWTA